MRNVTVDREDAASMQAACLTTRDDGITHMDGTNPRQQARARISTCAGQAADAIERGFLTSSGPLVTFALDDPQASAMGWALCCYRCTCDDRNTKRRHCMYIRFENAWGNEHTDNVRVYA